MKDRILLIFLALVLVVSLAAFAACKAEEEPPVVEEEEPPVVEEVWEWPRDFSILTYEVGSGSYAQAISIAPLIEADTGMRIRVVPEGNRALKSNWVKQRLFDVYIDDGAYRTIEGYEAPFLTREGGPYDVRLFAQFNINVFGIMVKGDSKIRTIYDVKPGTKISTWTMPGGLDIVKAVLAWVNLTVDDVILVETASYPDNMRMIADGRADVSVLCLPSSSIIVELEGAPYGLHWLDLNAEEDPEGAARYNEILPVHQFSRMEVGVPSAIGHWGWGSPQVALTRAETDAELVYQLVKWLDENYDRFKDVHVSMVYMTLESFRDTLNTTYIPVHEGAIRYLKEKGMWAAEDDVRQAYNLDLVRRYVQAYQEAMDMADAQAISINPANEKWVKLWEDYKKQLGLPACLIILEF